MPGHSNKKYKFVVYTANRSSQIRPSTFKSLPHPQPPLPPKVRLAHGDILPLRRNTRLRLAPSLSFAASRSRKLKQSSVALWRFETTWGSRINRTSCSRYIHLASSKLACSCDMQFIEFIAMF